MSKWEKIADGGRKRASNFAQTCNLLSQYIKEKGSLRDVNLEIARNLESPGIPDRTRDSTATTMDLLTNMEKVSNQVSSEVSPTMDLLPQYVGVGSSSLFEDDTNKSTSYCKSQTTAEPRVSQMTIFYAGQVMVFDAFPVDKAKEVFQLATITKGSDQDKAKANGSSAPPAVTETVPNSGSANAVGKPLQSPPLLSQSQPMPPPPPRSQSQAEASGSDLPIARRSSLHRFLEKRKDRAVVRAPYPAQNQAAGASTSSSSKQDEQLELKL